MAAINVAIGITFDNGTASLILNDSALLTFGRCDCNWQLLRAKPLLTIPALRTRGYGGLKKLPPD